MATLTSNSLSISNDLNLGEYDLSIQALNHTDSIHSTIVYEKTSSSITGWASADSFLGGGASFEFTGSFANNPYQLTKIIFSINSNDSEVLNIVFDGQISLDTNTKAQTGFYNHLGVTYTTGEKVDFYGKNDSHLNSIINFDRVRYQSADGQTLSLTGSLFIKENVNQLYGKLTSINYSDGQGHITSISGLSIDITSFSKTTSLSDLVPQLMSKNDNEMGTNAAEVMYGFGGNDTINGGSGADTLIGGNGDDTYALTLNSPDRIQEISNGGFDTVVIATNNSAKTAITLNISDFTYIEGLKVSGTGLFNLNGDSNNNRLTGNASDNSIAGGDGNDTLAGGGGNDTLSGGAGDDTYVLVNNNATVDEKINEGLDTVEIAFANAGSVITLDLGNYANIENLTVSGTGLYQLIGSSGNNLLKGNASANTINGNGGDDTMDGGAGDDVYIVDSTTDVVAESQPISTGGMIRYLHRSISPWVTISKNW